MKRKSPSSPHRVSSIQGGLFDSHPSSSRESKSLPASIAPPQGLVVVEKEPSVVSGDLYIIRKIQLGQQPGSLLMQLDEGIDKGETGILHASLRHLNDLRERAPIGQRQPRLSIKVKQDAQHDHLIHVTAAKKEDMAPFINFLEKQYHISKKTASEVMDLFEQSYKQEPSPSLNSI